MWVLILVYVSDYYDSSGLTDLGHDADDPDSDNNDDDDVANADAYEALSHREDPPILQSAVQDPLPPPSPTDASDHIDHSDVANCETTPFINRFSSGRSPSLSDHASNLSNNVWAPFCSQCDWEFAHWVKTRGVTSTAANELLAIPEVSISD